MNFSVFYLPQYCIIWLTLGTPQNKGNGGGGIEEDRNKRTGSRALKESPKALKGKHRDLDESVVMS